VRETGRVGGTVYNRTGIEPKPTQDL
jgi:hypothetical protein